jgi:hypothetical protein
MEHRNRKVMDDKENSMSGMKSKVDKLIKDVEAALNYEPEDPRYTKHFQRDVSECKECQEASRRVWPPSNLCGDHYCENSRNESKWESNCRYAQHEIKYMLKRALEEYGS